MLSLVKSFGDGGWMGAMAGWIIHATAAKPPAASTPPIQIQVFVFIGIPFLVHAETLPSLTRLGNSPYGMVTIPKLHGWLDCN
jgi:hypothetical protein